jgi:hypothetical protein
MSSCLSGVQVNLNDKLYQCRFIKLPVFEALAVKAVSFVKNVPVKPPNGSALSLDDD